MKRKGLAIILSLSMLFCACSGGGQGTMDQTQEPVNIGDEEQEDMSPTGTSLIEGNGEELEVAMLYASPFFQELVVDFNKKNPDYTIILRTPEAVEDWNDFRNRIRAEIGSGGGPDLLDGDLINVEEAVQKGYLKDMTDFCAQNRDRVWEAAWATGEADGKNYKVPYKCRFWTIVAGEELVGQRTTWNWKQMEQCLESAGCSMALGSLDQGVLEGERVFFYLGVFGKSRGGLIDWDKGISYLCDEDAVGLMETLKKHAYTGKQEEQGEKIVEGEIPAVMAVVRDIGSLQLLAALFQNREVYIGFPVEPEEKGGFLSSDGFVVNQASEKTEAIEAFLSYLLSEQIQQEIAQKSGETIMADGLPVDKDAMKLFCECALRGEYVDSNFASLNNFYGYQYENMVLTEKSLNKFCEAFENAGSMPDTEMISSIIYDEAQEYFSGNKSAQEAADTMHNRVRLYLEEMK